MASNVRPASLHSSFRWIGIAIIALSVSLITAEALLIPSHGSRHALMDEPDVTSPGFEAVKFEVGFCTYLASITGGIAAAMLASLKLDPTPGIWRGCALLSVFVFVTALALLSIGYAL